MKKEDLADLLGDMIATLRSNTGAGYELEKYANDLIRLAQAINNQELRSNSASTFQDRVPSNRQSYLEKRQR